MERGGGQAWLGWLRRLTDGLAWSAARTAVEAVRYQPAHLKLLVACGAGQPGKPRELANWLAEAQARPAVVSVLAMPHRMVRLVAARAADWFGPTASAVVRFSSGATAAAADRVGAATLERSLRGRVHPGLLVPHPHAVAVLAVDMRGFSQLTMALEDTQYLADVIEEYLSTMTRIVERHRGVVFQYTGDGLLALFLPELTGRGPGAMLDALLHEVAPALHEEFDALHGRWRTYWEAHDRRVVSVGLGVGVSYGQVTLGFLGASGKKQFGAIGEPVNLAAFLCAVAEAGTVLVDRESLGRAGFVPLRARALRVRSRKLGRRLDAASFRYGSSRDARSRRPSILPLPDPAA
jgi:class 3 adenylate cyclase